MEVDKGSDQKSDILPHWMVAHAPSKNKLTEDIKYNHDMAQIILYHQIPIFICFSASDNLSLHLQVSKLAMVKHQKEEGAVDIDHTNLLKFHTGILLTFVHFIQASY